MGHFAPAFYLRSAGLTGVVKPNWLKLSYFSTKLHMNKLILSIFLVFPSVSFAFGSYGHELICALAYKQLTPESQKRVDHLLDLSNQNLNFSEACVWPDKVKKTSQYGYTRPWHYVNASRRAKEVKASDCPEKGCVLSAISVMQARLEAAPHSDWQALFFLSHFIADIHQPMHVSYAHDLGGNQAKVLFRGKELSLHWLWDGPLLGLSPQLSHNVKRFEHEVEASFQNWKQGDRLLWANESFQLTQRIYQEYEQSRLIDQDYVETYQPLLEQRVVIAAVRLARRLEQAFNSTGSE